MTNELTLRKKADEAIRNAIIDGGDLVRDEGDGKVWVSMSARDTALDAICTALEDTGSPAHMRVAKELRGE